MPSRRGRNSHRSGRHQARKSKSRGVAFRRRKGNRPIALSKLPKRSQAARDRALHVLADKRHDPSLSLTRAANLQGVKLETVKKYFPSALKKVNGKLQVTKSDRYTATLHIPDRNGNSVAIRTRSSKERSDAGQYLGDIGRALRGDIGALSKWRGKKIAGVELLTDERALVAIEPALSEFSLYRIFNS
jgi:hypothetical protein